VRRNNRKDDSKNNPPFLQSQSQIQPGFFQGLNKSTTNHCCFKYPLGEGDCRANSLARPLKRRDRAPHCSGNHPWLPYRPASSQGLLGADAEEFQRFGGVGVQSGERDQGVNLAVEAVAAVISEFLHANFLAICSPKVSVSVRGC
jgi:hypothetical protein